ncbi:hypothetical protein SAMN05660226_02221 [Parapedobacter luteus]|uniref:Uncharacterized protein n=1 Tax=Parapedobacter luteus TaxID=623280 RepID=A0A1T5CH40_9SPHI|nr:hypothetical protein SAMN05660226_02221 [Parapedobacter luteus]
MLTTFQIVNYRKHTDKKRNSFCVKTHHARYQLIINIQYKNP